MALARHTLLQFLACAVAVVNCKCVWLMRWLIILVDY